MHGASGLVRVRAAERWRNVLILEQAIRRRAAEVLEQHLERETERAWIADRLGREPAESGMALVADRFEAEGTTGPPTSEELAAYRQRVSRDAPPFAVLVEEVDRQWFRPVRRMLGAPVRSSSGR